MPRVCEEAAADVESTGPLETPDGKPCPLVSPSSGHSAVRS